MKTPTIEQLLKKPPVLEIPTGESHKNEEGVEVDDTVRLYTRPPTETEKQLCIAAANLARRTLRKELNDTKSEKHQLLVKGELEEASPDQLRRIWVSGQLNEFVIRASHESLEEREYVPEPEGDFVRPAETDAYEDAVEEAEERRETSLIARMESERARLEKQAKKIAIKKLVEAAIEPHIETLCQNEYNLEFAAQLIARCSFTDEKMTKPAFKTSAMIRSPLFDPDARQKLQNHHFALLMNPTVLKTLAG